MPVPVSRRFVTLELRRRCTLKAPPKGRSASIVSRRVDPLPRALSLFGDPGGNGGGTSRFRLYRLARIFGKFLANGFLSERTAGGKSEHDRINTGRAA